MAPPSEVTFRAWLGVVAGEAGTPDEVELPTHLVELLIHAAKEGVVQEKDVLDETAALDKSRIKELVDYWHAIIEDAAADKKERPRKSELILFGHWLSKRFLEVEDVDVTPKSLPRSKQMIEDMSEQGATEEWQMGFIELALALGRPPSQQECKNYAYKAPWTSMDGGKAAIKFKLANLDEILKESIPSSNLAPVDAHFTTLAQSLMAERSDAFAMSFAGRLLAWWQEARQALKSPDMVLYYVKHYRRLGPGRGLWCLLDQRLVTSATSAKLSGELGVSLGALSSVQLEAEQNKAMVPSSSASTVSGVSSSISGVSSKQLTAFEGQMADILTAINKNAREVADLAQTVTSLKGTISTVQSSVATLELGPRCSKCKQRGHIGRDCPNKPDDSSSKKAGE